MFTLGPGQAPGGSVFALLILRESVAMSQRDQTAKPTSKPWIFTALTLVLLAVVTVLAHQSEGERLRQVEQDAAARLRSDLVKALDFASALQQASLHVPELSPGGDTLTITLPVAAGRVEEFRLFVDAGLGGLCLVRPGRPAELVANTVDAFKVMLDRRTDGRPVLWVELSACQSRAGEPPLRQHLYRSIVLESRPAGDHG